MEIVEVWLLFGAEIHQDFLIDYPDILQGFREIFDRFSSAQRHELHQFLEDVLSREPSAPELSELWNKSGAKILAVESDMPNFFQVILWELEASIRASE